MGRKLLIFMCLLSTVGRLETSRKRPLIAKPCLEIAKKKKKKKKKKKFQAKLSWAWKVYYIYLFII